MRGARDQVIAELKVLLEYSSNIFNDVKLFITFMQSKLHFPPTIVHDRPLLQSNMSSISSFSLFPQFPKEIRLSIWDRTFEPRLISFPCEKHEFDFENQPSFQYFLHRPGLNITSPARATTLTARFLPRDVDAVIALSVCHESRGAALLRYKPWKIENQHGEIKIMMWDPEVDIVELVMAPEDNPISRFLNLRFACYYTVFEMEFPAQTKEIKHLAVPTHLWIWKWSEPMVQYLLGPSGRILNFESLQRVVVILSEEESRLGDPSGSTSVTLSREGDSWYISDLAGKLVENARSGWGDWKMPLVQAVASKDDILPGKFLKICVRK